jgi:hypothetical protein
MYICMSACVHVVTAGIWICIAIVHAPSYRPMVAPYAYGQLIIIFMNLYVYKCSQRIEFKIKHQCKFYI